MKKMFACDLIQKYNSECWTEDLPDNNTLRCVTESQILVHHCKYNIAWKFIAFGQCNVLLKHYTATQIASYEIIAQEGACGCVIVLFRKYPWEQSSETATSGILSEEYLCKWQKFLMAIYGLKTSRSFCPTVEFCYLVGNGMFAFTWSKQIMFYSDKLKIIKYMLIITNKY